MSRNGALPKLKDIILSAIENVQQHVVKAGTSMSLGCCNRSYEAKNN
jgi:hypothetical protein